jgi:hypothetical protein
MPWTGKVDRRLALARHGLFNVALTIPPAPAFDPRWETCRRSPRRQGVGRPLPARTCYYMELAAGMASRVLPTSTRADACPRTAARSARAFPAIGTLAFQARFHPTRPTPRRVDGSSCVASSPACSRMPSPVPHVAAVRSTNLFIVERPPCRRLWDHRRPSRLPYARPPRDTLLKSNEHAYRKAVTAKAQRN